MHRAICAVQFRNTKDSLYYWKHNGI